MVVETVGTVLALGIAGGIGMSVLGISHFKNPWISVLGLIILLGTLMTAFLIAPIAYNPVGGTVAAVLALAVALGIGISVLGLARFQNPYVIMLGLIILIVAITTTFSLAAV